VLKAVRKGDLRRGSCRAAQPCPPIRLPVGSSANTRSMPRAKPGCRAKIRRSDRYHRPGNGRCQRRPCRTSYRLSSLWPMSSAQGTHGAQITLAPSVVTITFAAAPTAPLLPAPLASALRGGGPAPSGEERWGGLCASSPGPCRGCPWLWPPPPPHRKGAPPRGIPYLHSAAQAVIAPDTWLRSIIRFCNRPKMRTLRRRTGGFNDPCSAAAIARTRTKMRSTT